MMYNKEQLKERNASSLSLGVQNYIQDVQTKKKTSSICQGCPLFGSPMVILDTNMEDFGPVDIVFLGLNPGKDEVKQGLPFVGKAGRLLREQIASLPPGTTYLITNLILCHTNDESKIPSPSKVIKNCQSMRDDILYRFPAKFYVPLGGKAIKSMGVNDSVIQASGNLYDNPSYINVFPIMHPSAVYRPSQSKQMSNKDIFNMSFENLKDLLTTGGK